jgi:transcription antitermination factor NusG
MKPTHVWYAVYTRPRWEKKVATLLTQKRIQNYCPLNKVVKQWHDRKKVIHEPLFTSYVFVCLTQAEMVEVKKTEGVLNFVYWLGKPAVIRDEEIATIKQFLECHSEVKLDKRQIKVEDHVQIVHGPLLQKEGRVLEVHQKTIKVLLPTLGYALVAQVSLEHVELIKAAEPKETSGKKRIDNIPAVIVK